MKKVWGWIGEIFGVELRAADSMRRRIEWVRRYTDGNEAETGRYANVGNK